MQTFHRIWFGNHPIPTLYERYWSAWQRQFPDGRFVTWRDAEIAQLPLTRHKIAEARSVAAKADIARYEILHHHGGVYLDADVMPYHRLPVERLRDQLVTCNETETGAYCSTGFIAAPAAHPVFAEIIREINELRLNARPVNEETGPSLFGRHLSRHPQIRLPVQAFYPYLHDEPRSRTLSRDLTHTYGIHVWGGSWLNAKVRLQKARRLLSEGELAEVLDILAGATTPEAEQLRGLAREVQKLRGATLRLLLRLPTDPPGSGTLNSHLRFETLAYWLLEQAPDTLVWRIGVVATSGVDPLEPALVNFDPDALMIDPDGQALAEVRTRYARNTRLQTMHDPIDVDMAAQRMNDRWPEILTVDATRRGIASVDALLDRDRKPALIRIEQAAPHGPPEIALLDRLRSSYVVTRDRGAWTACRADLMRRYASHLYLHHGMPTISSRGLRMLHGSGALPDALSPSGTRG